MDKNNRPHSRDKEVSSGTAHVGKGEQVNTGGPVGGGQQQSQNQQRAGGAGSALGLLAIFMALPKKLRTVLLIAVAVIALFSLFNPGAGPEEPYEEYDSSYSAPAQQPQSAPAQQPQAAPATPAPTPAPTPMPTPAATPAPTPKPASASTVGGGAGRSKRVVPLGNGQDTVTVMIYMCGTDLESKYGMGTSDLNEMVNASISDKVNVIVETGGCRAWKNSVVSSRVNEIYKVQSNGLIRLSDNAGTASMTDPANLTSFIQFCNKNFPADRNILIFWDHGGGSLTGYGYDEKHASSSSMTLDKIDKALADSGCTFDWIGYDACLMATLETALVCEKYADYMIASEESEPGTGWYYTDWLNQLSRNTSTDTLSISRTIIDTFVKASQQSSPRAQVTLSVMDLAELSGAVPAAFREFSSSTCDLLKGEGYTQVSNARAGVRQFAQSSKINQIDLIDLCNRIGTPESRDLASALQSCIKYNNSTISRAYGVSIYFPYETLRDVNSAMSTYNSVGMDSEYTDFIKSFASLAQGGHVASQSSSYGGGSSSFGSYSDLLEGLLGAYSGSSSSSYSSSPIGSLLGGYTNASGSSSAGGSISASDIIGLMNAFSGRSMPSSLEWMDTELVAESAEMIASQSLDPGRITVTDKNGQRVLSLTDEEWDLIQSVELNIFVEDGEGFIDLGLDNVFEFDEDGDMLLDYDKTWLTLNGHVVAYYMLSDTDNLDGTYTTVGRIPVILKRGSESQLVNLMVLFDAENPRGVITGAYPFYEAEVETEAKGAIQLLDTDVLQPVCDYYNLDGSYSASYTLGSSFELGSQRQLTNMLLDGEGYSVTYRLTDVFGNHYWTPAFTA